MGVTMGSCLGLVPGGCRGPCCAAWEGLQGPGSDTAGLGAAASPPSSWGLVSVCLGPGGLDSVAVLGAGRAQVVQAMGPVQPPPWCWQGQWGPSVCLAPGDSSSTSLGNPCQVLTGAQVTLNHREF